MSEKALNSSEKAVKEPLFHIEKRAAISAKNAWAIRLGSIFAALVLSSIIAAIFVKAGPLDFFGNIFDGAVGTPYRIWILLRDTALLLGVAIAIVPAFKMRFWNLGANGQVLMGCLATTACMFYFGDKVPLIVLYLLMIVSSVVAGAIWAVIPAIFKAQWKTNESLFTLMMNYIAEGLVAYCLSIWVKNGTSDLPPMSDYKLPAPGNDQLLTIIVAAVLTVAMFVYLKFSKHGYELTVVGESENTARYVGISVKKVVIRTMILSGALCGVVGLLLSGSINGTVSTTMVDNRGFTAIMVAWLGKFNPGVMAAMSFFIIFLDRGVNQVNRRFQLTNNAFSDIVTAIVFFFIIGCEFFISYKLKFRPSRKKSEKDAAITEESAVIKYSTAEVTTEENTAGEKQSEKEAD